MKLGGWQRLWVLVSGLYLVVVVTFVSSNWPGVHSVSHSQALDNLSPELKNKIASSEPKYKRQKDIFDELTKEQRIEVEMPNGYILEFAAELPREEVEDVAQQYWKSVESELTSIRLQVAGFAFLWWFVPMVALYVLAWSVGWVYRGFTSS